MAELDASLKIKSVGCLMTSHHPLIKLLKTKLDLSNYFEPKCKIKIDSILKNRAWAFEIDRVKLWGKIDPHSHKELLNSIRNVKIKDVLSKDGCRSVIFFMISKRALKIKELRSEQLAKLERFIDREKIEIEDPKLDD